MLQVLVRWPTFFLTRAPKTAGSHRICIKSLSATLKASKASIRTISCAVIQTIQNSSASCAPSDCCSFGLSYTLAQVGRADSQIMLANGEKTNPEPLGALNFLH